MSDDDDSDDLGDSDDDDSEGGLGQFSELTQESINEIVYSLASDVTNEFQDQISGEISQTTPTVQGDNLALQQSSALSSAQSGSASSDQTPVANACYEPSNAPPSNQDGTNPTAAAAANQTPNAANASYQPSDANASYQPATVLTSSQGGTNPSVPGPTNQDTSGGPSFQSPVFQPLPAPTNATVSSTEFYESIGPLQDPAGGTNLPPSTTVDVAPPTDLNPIGGTQYPTPPTPAPTVPPPGPPTGPTIGGTSAGNTTNQDTAGGLSLPPANLTPEDEAFYGALVAETVASITLSVVSAVTPGLEIVAAMEWPEVLEATTVAIDITGIALENIAPELVGEGTILGAGFELAEMVPPLAAWVAGAYGTYQANIPSAQIEWLTNSLIQAGIPFTLDPYGVPTIAPPGVPQPQLPAGLNGPIP